MAKYEVTENEDELFIVERETKETSKTFHKQWLIDEIARLQTLLDKFSK